MTDISELQIELAAARLEVERLQEINDELRDCIPPPTEVSVAVKTQIDALRKYNRTLKDLVIFLLKAFPD